MTRLSFAIVVLMLFNPLYDLWRRVIESPPTIQVLGFSFRANSPYIGAAYLVVLGILGWLAIWLLLMAAEKYVLRDLSRRRFFRDGVTLASGPSLIHYPEIAAKWVFWAILLKLLLEALISFLLTLPIVLRVLPTTIAAFMAGLVAAVRGGSDALVLELMLLALSFLLLFLKRFFYAEKDALHFELLKEVQRKSGAEESPVTRQPGSLPGRS